MNTTRFFSRNKVWPETEAVIKYPNVTFSHTRSVSIFKGKIDNLSSQGMFIKTNDGLKLNTKLDILINFNPDTPPVISLKAEGVVLRSENEGFAVRFTKINTQDLGECIIQKLNARSTG